MPQRVCLRTASFRVGRVVGHPSTRCPHIKAWVSTTETTATAEPLSVWLPAREVQDNVVLQTMPQGKGQVVVVVDVALGSTAAEAGIVKGQKLVGISDPVRDHVWELGDRPSLRFVRDTLQMRRMGQVQLVLQAYLNASDPAWANPASSPPADAPVAAETAAAADADGAVTGEVARATLLDSLLSTSSMSDEEGAAPTANAAGEMTVGERMAAQYAARQQMEKQQTEVEKRMQKRAAYLEEVSQRNDAPMLAGLTLAFVLPPAVILAIAAGTGYLDKLYNNSLTLQ